MGGISAFLDCFASLPEPRQQSKVWCPLAGVLLLLLGRQAAHGGRPAGQQRPRQETTTTRIAQTVLDRGADDLLALKGNCSALLADTEALGER